MTPVSFTYFDIALTISSIILLFLSYTNMRKQTRIQKENRNLADPTSMESRTHALEVRAEEIRSDIAEIRKDIGMIKTDLEWIKKSLSTQR